MVSPNNQAKYNKAFVLVEYFGYLQRNPDQQWRVWTVKTEGSKQ